MIKFSDIFFTFNNIKDNKSRTDELAMQRVRLLLSHIILSYY